MLWQFKHGCLIGKQHLLDILYMSTCTVGRESLNLLHSLHYTSALGMNIFSVCLQIIFSISTNCICLCFFSSLEHKLIQLQCRTVCGKDWSQTFVLLLGQNILCFREDSRHWKHIWRCNSLLDKSSNIMFRFFPRGLLRGKICDQTVEWHPVTSALTKTEPVMNSQTASTITPTNTIFTLNYLYFQVSTLSNSGVSRLQSHWCCC